MFSFKGVLMVILWLDVNVVFDELFVKILVLCVVFNELM